ncbi:UDP-N-acetylmuramate dehydrogenase [Candidatus Kinetoplastibacterium desouzaii TCC079E]|uniref:UDP-N-acetylenolpyruvoylglucosamine reductase n=1 Tax=Candidatus Kinetoplastidibacterium desouzai TCC079E TaxID=1208919 RepID=M1LSH2_9PROT|nr:UDP-N-acetylmuramate dehydrogenase [Candidatus Kinetoplastibacterium desouzaii]AGF47081.1 UDP-N-acetylmuramate dehydrogenase [Candidatus Kinetoplastibacterium desouzaii TCC079E]
MKPCYQNLKSFNTFGIDIHTNNFLTISKVKDLEFVFHNYNKYPNVFIIGGGSNVILSHNVINSLIVKLNFFGISVLYDSDDSVLIEVGSGESWHELVDFCLVNGWYGLENLALIPGTVGGAPVQNIGAYGVEFSKYCYSVVVWDPKNNIFLELYSDECEFSYRNSIFKNKSKNNYFIVSVRFSLEKKWKPVLTYPGLVERINVDNVTPRDVFNVICEIRREKIPDPANIGNVGSFFKNPIVNLDILENLKRDFSNVVFWDIPDNKYKISAGWLISVCGWKGKSIGPVSVHKNQALILVNNSNANSSHVLYLAKSIQNDVFNKTSIYLDIEPSLL